MSKRDPTWISEWNPEDEKFWKSKGKAVAQRNLIWSIVAEHLGFSIWLIWSIVATKLPQAGFHYTTDQLFQLVALPGLIGSLMRFPYTFAVTTFGGRNWTVFSAAVLFIPTLALAYFVTQPDTPFWLMLLVAATAGLGGGNFASSMANISFFYPDRIKGWALGLNAAGGNIGVSGVQLLTPILMGFGFISLYLASPTAEGLYLQNAGLMWLLPLTIAVIGAFFFMNNLTDGTLDVQRPTRHRQAQAYLDHVLHLHRDIRVVHRLLRRVSAADQDAVSGGHGRHRVPRPAGRAPCSRPLGGLLADKIGGAKVTFWNFIAMGAATIGVMYFVEIKSFAGFLTMFLILFVTTGVGNGSTYRMIPSIFREEKLQEARGSGETGRALALEGGRVSRPPPRWDSSERSAPAAAT